MSAQASHGAPRREEGLMTKGKSMKRDVGLWIDHRKAVIVTLADEWEETKLIRSNVEERGRLSGGSRGSRSKTLYGPQDVSAEDKRERRLAGHLSKYYHQVISCIRDAESILIFGPGEAKAELTKRIESEGLRGRIVGVETVDKMTDRQIAARVRLRFRKESSPKLPRREEGESDGRIRSTGG